MPTEPWRNAMELAKDLIILDVLLDVKCSSLVDLLKSEIFHFVFTYVRNHF